MEGVDSTTAKETATSDASRQSAVRWWPSPEVVADTNLTAFLKMYELADFETMRLRSEQDRGWFWTALLRWSDVRFYKSFTSIVDLSAGEAAAKWCVGATTNIVLNCLDRHRETATYQKDFLVWEGEDGRQRTLTYAEVDAEICRLSNGLRQLGVGRGDVVAIFMPIIPETFIAYFAILKIGAVVMPLYSGFGTGALVSRLKDGGAKVVFTVDATRRRGQLLPMMSTLDPALAQCPGVEHCVIVPDLGIAIDAKTPRDKLWQKIVDGQSEVAATEAMGSDEPAILLFTSGTTGRPKGVVYTHIGFMAKLICDVALCFDFRSTDRYFWLCDMGWMAGSIVALAPALCGGSVLIADGTPDYPQPDRLWDLIERHRVTYAAVTPTMIRSLMQRGTADVAGREFKQLRVIYSSGEPWTDTPWTWLFENVCKGRVPILNGTGGTEIGGCILGCTLHHGLKPSSFSTAMPAMGADVVDGSGSGVSVGTIGELVLRKTSIGLTAGLWKDSARYVESYWSQIPGMWVQGDLAYRDVDGHWYVPGRSDDTLNVAGRRMGPAEIENVLLETNMLMEAAAVAVPDAITGVALACVCVPKAGIEPSLSLRQQLLDAVASKLGRSFRPKRLIFVAALPKTRSSKIMRRAVRSVLCNEPPGDLSALANPESLEGLRDAAAVA